MDTPRSIKSPFVPTTHDVARMAPRLPASAPTDGDLDVAHPCSDELETELTALRSRCQHLEEHLRQSQKMAAIGQLTSGIIHDFNNLLTGVGGSLELMQIGLARGRVAEVSHHLGSALTSVARTGALTQRLLAIVRKQPLNPQPVQVGELVASIEALIRRAVGSGIHVGTSFDCPIWGVRCDANQLEIALLNLCLNARDAMPEGGRLAIEGRNVAATEVDAAARGRAMMPGDYVALLVTDTGLGMPPEVVAHVGEPFFTTKPAGQGTGLGLSQVCTFVRDAGGRVMIDSTVGRGTTITVLLPRDASGKNETANTAQGGTVQTVESCVEEAALSQVGFVSLLDHAAPCSSRGCRFDPDG